MRLLFIPYYIKIFKLKNHVTAYLQDIVTRYKNNNNLVAFKFQGDICSSPRGVLCTVKKIHACVAGTYIVGISYVFISVVWLSGS